MASERAAERGRQGFFELLRLEATVAREMAEAMAKLMGRYEDVPSARKQMKDMEHRADEIVHVIHEAINETFVTPIEREDLRELASKLDEVIDMLYASVLRLDLYDVGEPDEGMRDLADITLKSVVRLEEAIRLLERRDQGDRVEQLCVEVNQLENEADEVMNRSIAALFREREAIDVIKLKEIYEKMELATDLCEDVADVLSDIVAKNR